MHTTPQQRKTKHRHGHGPNRLGTSSHVNQIITTEMLQTNMI